MLLTSSPNTTMSTLTDIVEGPRRLAEATREASRWHTVPRRRRTHIAGPTTRKAVAS